MNFRNSFEIDDVTPIKPLLRKSEQNEWKLTSCSHWGWTPWFWPWFRIRKFTSVGVPWSFLVPSWLRPAAPTAGGISSVVLGAHDLRRGGEIPADVFHTDHPWEWLAPTWMTCCCSWTVRLTSPAVWRWGRCTCRMPQWEPAPAARSLVGGPNREGGTSHAPRGLSMWWWPLRWKNSLKMNNFSKPLQATPRYEA